MAEMNGKPTVSMRVVATVAALYPYYLPDERITLVVMLNSGIDIPGSWRLRQDIVPIVSRLVATLEGECQGTSRGEHQCIL